jgi:hypothetical protein
MRALVLSLLLSLSAILVIAPLQAQTDAPPSNELKVFVQPLQGPDGDLAKSVTAKLIGELQKHGLAIAYAREDADAILSGSGLMQTNKSLSLGHRPSLCIRGGMRLVNKNGVAIWVEDVSSARYAVSESASFVDKVANGVSEAMAEETKRRASEPAPQK